MTSNQAADLPFRQGQSAGQWLVMIGLDALIVDVIKVAAPGDQVMVMETLRPAMAFARSGLEVLRNDGDREVDGVDYLVTCYRRRGQAWEEPDPHLVDRIGGAARRSPRSSAEPIRLLEEASSGH